MFILDNTNQFLGQLAIGLQFLSIVVMLLLFGLNRKYSAVYMKVYGVVLALLFCITLVRLYVFNLNGWTDMWYSPHVIANLTMIPVFEGLMYSLYRQGTTLGYVIKRVLLGEIPFAIIAVLTFFFGFVTPIKYVAYAYAGIYGIVTFIFVQVRTDLFNKQIMSAYSDTSNRGIAWVNNVMWIMVVWFLVSLGSKLFVEVWIRVATDYVTVFVFTAVGFYIARQKPVDDKLLDLTRMFLSGNLVDTIHMRVIDEDTPNAFKEVGQTITAGRLIEIAKRFNEFFANSAEYRNPEFTISDMARCIDEDSVSLSFYVNYEIGIPFYNLINDYRLDYAERLLINEPDIPVRKVCDMAGFPDMEVMDKLMNQRHLADAAEYRDAPYVSMDEIMAPLFAKLEPLYPGFRKRIKSKAPYLSEREEAYAVLLLCGYTKQRASGFLGTTMESLDITERRLKSKLGLLHTYSLLSVLRTAVE